MHPTKKNADSDWGYTSDKTFKYEEIALGFSLGIVDIRQLDTDSEFRYTLVQTSEGEYPPWIPLGNTDAEVKASLFKMAPSFVHLANSQEITEEEFYKAQEEYFDALEEFLGWPDEETEEQVAKELEEELVKLGLFTETRPAIIQKH